MKKSLALVVPCYNEQEVLPLFYEEVGKVLKKLSAGFLTELVFVNDGSADGTLGILKDLAEKDPTVKYISFSRNFGKEAAMLAGMEYAVKSDYIGIIDADLQHSPELITEMLYYVDQEGFDVAAARREDRAGEAKLKSALSGGFYKVINKISDTKISDSAQDFRFPDDTVLHQVMALPAKYRQAVLLRYYQGLKLREVAEALGISEGAVRKRLKGANARLRQALKEWYDDEE